MFTSEVARVNSEKQVTSGYQIKNNKTRSLNTAVLQVARKKKSFRMIHQRHLADLQMRLQIHRSGRQTVVDRSATIYRTWVGLKRNFNSSKENSKLRRHVGTWNVAAKDAWLVSKFSRQCLAYVEINAVILFTSCQSYEAADVFLNSLTEFIWTSGESVAVASMAPAADA